MPANNAFEDGINQSGLAVCQCCYGTVALLDAEYVETNSRGSDHPGDLASWISASSNPFPIAWVASQKAAGLQV
jgi:hypothetical protein